MEYFRLNGQHNLTSKGGEVFRSVLNTWVQHKVPGDRLFSEEQKGYNSSLKGDFRHY